MTCRKFLVIFLALLFGGFMASCNGDNGEDEGGDADVQQEDIPSEADVEVPPDIPAEDVIEDIVEEDVIEDEGGGDGEADSDAVADMDTEFDPEGVVDVREGTTPTIDGVISPDEWSDSSTVNFQAYSPYTDEITITCHIKHDGESRIFIAVIIPNFSWGDRDLIHFDMEHNGDDAPQPDDLCLNIFHSDGAPFFEAYGTGTEWGNWREHTSNWDFALTGGWGMEPGAIEIEVEFSKLGITPGVSKTLGFMVTFGDLKRPYDPSHLWSWPSDGSHLAPDTWGDMIVLF